VSAAANRSPSPSSAAVAAGSPATAPGGAWQRIYAEYVSLAWRGLRRLGVPESMIEDAVQDVFLVVHRRHAGFEGRSSLKTWIYGIVVRVAKDYRRAEARRVSRAERLAEALAADPERAAAPTPADEAERREANRLLHAALDALDGEHRESLVLVELEELPVREAAAALGISVRACQRRLQAARRRFDDKVLALIGDTRRSTA
jgi:RNA polymerase sigma-70 factor (ECF subfamily)